MVKNYTVFTEECEIYYIAIGMFQFVALWPLHWTYILVMCPDQKLQWFKDHGFLTAVTWKLKQLVINQWEMQYKPEPVLTSVSEPSVSSIFSLFSITHSTQSFIQQCKNHWLQKPLSGKAPAGNLDDIHTYLKEPIIPSSTITDSEGYLKWWQTTAGNCPSLARIAMDYCSTPGMLLILLEHYSLT